MVLFTTTIESKQVNPAQTPANSAENSDDLPDNMPIEPKPVAEFEKPITDKMLEKAASIIELEDKLDKIAEIPDIPKESVGKKTKQELLADIKRLELALGKQHKPVSKFSRVQLEQYIVSLLDESARTIQNNDINSKLDNLKLPKEEAVRNNIEELKQKLREDQAKKGQNGQQSPDECRGYADFLFRANFLVLYGLERVSLMYEDEMGTSLQGASDQMQKDKNDILIPIYMKLYKEYAESIKQYATPMVELALYNVQLMGSTAAMNVKKKLEKRQ